MKTSRSVGGKVSPATLICVPMAAMAQVVREVIVKRTFSPGGESWENGIHLINQNIKTIALKDFKWGKVDNDWKIINTPIGEGMVDFKKYFSLLKSYKILVPASLHFEYSLGGAEHGSKKLGITKNSLFKKMKKDLLGIIKNWKEAA